MQAKELGNLLAELPGLLVFGSPCCEADLGMAGGDLGRGRGVRVNPDHADV